MTSTFVSLMLARRGLTPTPAFCAEPVARPPAKDFVLKARARFVSSSEIAVRVVAIVALLFAAGASLDRDAASSASGEAAAIHA